MRRARGSGRSHERQISRLLRWYPRAWRERYGSEFAALLSSDLAERPRSLGRTFDVVRAGLNARLGMTGLVASGVLDGAAEVRAGLGAMACCLAAFLTCSVALWSQLTIGWQWSKPGSASATIAMVAMSVLLPVLLLLGLVAAVPVSLAGARALRGGRGGLGIPLALVGTGAFVLIVGSCLFDHGWPGTGGHPWAGRSLVPGGLASVAWTATVSVTSYWAHPARLGAFPALELGWMTIAPMAIAALTGGVTMTLRRLELSPHMLRFETRVARLATQAMVCALAGAAIWVLSGDGGPRRLFATGAINSVELSLMAVTAVGALATARRVQRLTA